VALITTLGLLLIAIAAIWWSADKVVVASQKIARSLKISTTFVGLTILSIGTSVPEIGMHVISSLAILRGEKVSGIALGTNIGSNIVQVTAIMGILALITSIKANNDFLKKDYLFMLGGILLVFILGIDGTFSRLDGIILIGSYMYYLYSLGKKEHFGTKIGRNHNHIWLQLFYLTSALALLLVAANFALRYAHDLATILNVSDSLIGVALIGVSTALPELTTALIGLKKKAAGISIGVLIGSNITNPLLGIGIGAIISTYEAVSRVQFYDLPMWFLVASLTLIPFWKNGKIGKKTGIALILFYIVFIAIRVYLK
jgi:cation:H+ antiporter